MLVILSLGEIYVCSFRGDKKDDYEIVLLDETSRLLRGDFQTLKKSYILVGMVLMVFLK